MWKLVVLGLALASAVIFLIFNAVNAGGTQLYLTVDEFYAKQASLDGRDLRVSGWVVADTIQYKVNPIDFENAEGNLGLANALLGHFAEKLPISRWQRDLTDSTVQRNFGVAIGYIVIALAALLKGFGKLELSEEKIRRDIDGAWEVLAEAVQTVMRRHGIPEPYEKLKQLTRGQAVTQQLLADFIATLEIPDAEKQRLLALTPSQYLGLAARLATEI
jgi:adenylosuccinate lyase